MSYEDQQTKGRNITPNRHGHMISEDRRHAILTVERDGGCSRWQYAREEDIAEHPWRLFTMDLPKGWSFVYDSADASRVILWDGHEEDNGVDTVRVIWECRPLDGVDQDRDEEKVLPLVSRSRNRSLLNVDLESDPDGDPMYQDAPLTVDLNWRLHRMFEDARSPYRDYSDIDAVDAWIAEMTGGSMDLGGE